MKAIRQLITLAVFVFVAFFGVQYGKLFLIKQEIEKVAAKNKIVLDNTEVLPLPTPHLKFSINKENKYLTGQNFELSQKWDQFKTADIKVTNLKLYRKKRGTLLLQSASFNSQAEYKEGGLHFDKVTAKDNAAMTKIDKFVFPEMLGRFSYTFNSKELKLNLRIPSLRTAKNPNVDITAVSISGAVICAKNGANGQIKLLVSRFKPSLFKHLEKNKTVKKGFGKFLQFGNKLLSGMFKGSKVPVIIDFKDGEPRYRVEFPS